MNNLLKYLLTIAAIAMLLVFSGCFERFSQKQADDHAGETAAEHAAHSEEGHEGETAEEHAAHSEDGHEGETPEEHAAHSEDGEGTDSGEAGGE